MSEKITFHNYNAKPFPSGVALCIDDLPETCHLQEDVSGGITSLQDFSVSRSTRVKGPVARCPKYVIAHPIRTWPFLLVIRRNGFSRIASIPLLRWGIA
ncbi:MAG: hypothetical protein QM743_13765 [Chitinophagaceae bacterium]